MTRTSTTDSKERVRELSNLLLEDVDTMVRTARESLSSIGVGDHPSFAEVDEQSIRHLKHVRQFTWDKYTCIIDMMNEIKNR